MNEGGKVTCRLSLFVEFFCQSKTDGKINFLKDFY